MSQDLQSPYVYVDSSTALGELGDRLRRAPRVAVDTEANSLYRYHEQVCLIQLSLNGDNYIVDPLARLDLSHFLQVLADKPLIFHGADYDLRMMRSSFGFRPRGEVFDTMIAAQLLGQAQVGLASLVAQFFGVPMSKHAQKANWTLRPLRPTDLTYAVEDTRYLERLADLLRDDLLKQDRLDWHREACERLIEATEEDNHRDPEAEWRLKGSSKLDRRQLAFVRQLWYWREKEAANADRPPFKILGNAQLVDLALWAAAHPNGSLAEGPRLPRHFTGRRLWNLQQTLRQAHRLPESEWPSRHVRRPSQHGEPDCRPLVEALQAQCASVAQGLNLPPSIVAPRAALVAVARARPGSIEEIMECGPLMRWQAELLAPGIRGVLDGN